MLERQFDRTDAGHSHNTSSYIGTHAHVRNKKTKEKNKCSYQFEPILNRSGNYIATEKRNTMKKGSTLCVERYNNNNSRSGESRRKKKPASSPVLSIFADPPTPQCASMANLL